MIIWDVLFIKKTTHPILVKFQVTSEDRLPPLASCRHRQVQAHLLRQGKLQEAQTLKGQKQVYY